MTDRMIELNRRNRMLYTFLAGYKQNSGIFINNFFRNRDYQTYCEDKFESFDFDVSGSLPNLFDDIEMSMAMVDYLGKLEDNEMAYYPITPEYIAYLIAFAEVLDILEPTKEDMVVYRGCSTLERNGVNGVVSTTTDRKIAEQFSRGTILTIHVPKGTKCLNVKRIRPREQQKHDYENEILLPPCDFEIISEREVEPGNEPNNHKDKTKLIELVVNPLDLLEEFLKRLDNPPQEYIPIQNIQGRTYSGSVEMLRSYIENRERANVLKKSYNIL